MSIIHIEVNGEVEISINFILPQLRPRCPPCWTPHQSYSVINIHSSQSLNENARKCSAQITCQKKSHESTSQVNSLALRPFRKTCLGKNPLSSTCWRSVEYEIAEAKFLKKSLRALIKLWYSIRCCWRLSSRDNKICQIFKFWPFKMFKVLIDVVLKLCATIFST